MLPWSLFSNALSEASNSLINNANLIGKVYFPRLIIPAATLVTAFINFLISFIIMVAMMLYYQFLPGWQMLLLPFFIILAGNSPIYLPGFLLSLAIIAFFLYLGISRFRKMEKTFADLI